MHRLTVHLLLVVGIWFFAATDSHAQSSGADHAGAAPSGPAAALPGGIADGLPGSLRQPTGRVILTVKGSIENRNSPNGAEFDYDMLKELGLKIMQIDTPWTDEGSLFEGVSTRNLLAAVGATGNWVRAGAANDYRIDVPFTDLSNYDTLLGLSLDGKRMTLRDKGPIWLLYSNQNHPPVAESELRARMVWQLTTLTID